MSLLSWLSSFLGYTKNCEKLEKYEEEKSNFPLGKLPIVPIVHIIRLMSINERINLALSSKKMEKCVKHSRVKVKFYWAHLEDHFSHICMQFVAETTIYCGLEFENPYGNQEIMSADLKPWLNVNNSAIENTINVFQRIQELFPSKGFGLGLDLDNMKMISIKDALAIPAFKNYELFMIYGEKVEAKDLDFIMETVPVGRDLCLDTKEIPKDYSHEYAFVKFRSCHYTNARWVQIEHLFSLNNNYLIKLGKNNLRCNDLNKLIKYWINSDCDMFRVLQIKLKEEILSEREVVLDGVIVLKAFQSGTEHLLITCKPDKSRKYKVLSVQWNRKYIHLYTYEPHKVSFKLKTPWIREYEILKILSKKKELENELEEIEKKEVEIEGLLEENEERIEEYREEIQKMTNKKVEITREVQKLMDELINQNVYFAHGQPVFE